MINIYNRAEGKNIAGNNHVFLTERANLAGVSHSGGEITNLALVAGKYFQQIQADVDSIVFTEIEEDTEGVIWYEQLLYFIVSRASKETNTLIDSIFEASADGILAIFTNNNGHSWLVGWNEVDFTRRAMKMELTKLTNNSQSIMLRTASAYTIYPFNNTLNLSVLTQIIAGGGAPVGLTFGEALTVDATDITVDSTVITTDRTIRP